jgi:uncharacterized protein YndB with AHSA1/START domain
MTTRHVYRIYIRATPEQVWAGITDPAFTRRYFHTTAFDEPPQSGQPYRTTTVDGHPAVDGIIEVCEPPRRLVQTWHVLYDAALADEPPSRVEWTITAAGDGLVRLDVVHGDLARSPRTWARVKDGWVWILDSLKSLLETGEPLADETSARPEIVDDPAAEWHRAQAIEANNGCWEVIEADRGAGHDEELLRRAYAAAYHWQRAAGRSVANEVRSRWMLSKAHLLAGAPSRALHYAEECMALCVESGIADFDIAYAHDALARAHHALGDPAAAAHHQAAARSVPIADPEDEAVLAADLAVAL